MFKMQSYSSYENRNLKQIKVDNWGTFFLQRLLQLYFNEKLLDLKIKFTSTNDEINVHKLVMATCTDYFIQLKNEREENSAFKDVVTLPTDMPYECVKSIVSFVYTGQLEYWTSEQAALYSTAKKMNMTVLTKLLDAQEGTHKDHNSDQPVHLESLISDSEKYTSPTKDLIGPPFNIHPEQKFHVWANSTDCKIPITTSKTNPDTPCFGRNLSQNGEGPSRFDLPEVEDSTLGVFSSFDDITYNTQPILRAQEKINHDRKVSNLFSNAASNQIVMIEDETDYTEESIAKNNFDDCSVELQSMLKVQENETPLKRRRYEYNEKENQKESGKNFLISSNKIKSSICLDNHAKIVREVLKKYPHLIKNKNIRLKIMQKESKNADCTLSGKTKVSYAVLTSESLKIDADDQNISLENSDFKNLDDNYSGPWKCDKCDLDNEYINYSMYRRHVQDVHGKKFDPRICEYCGYRATKRNILMYHLYTKHNIPIPKSMSFPKCDICSYVALSESLLIKHQMSHKHAMNTHHFPSGSNKCEEYKKHFVDVNELACHEMTRRHKISTNDLKRNVFYSSSDDTFINDFKSHSESEKNVEKNNSRSNSPIFQSLNISSFDDNSYDADNFIGKTYRKKCEVNYKGDNKAKKFDYLQKLPISQIYSNTKNLEPGKRIDCSSEITKVNKFFLPNSGENMIIYVDNVENKDHHIINDNEEENNELYVHNKSKNIQKFAEKIEILENKDKKLLITSELRNEQDINNEREVPKNAEYSVNRDIASEVKETIQYVEEETEILEYETCNTA